MSTDTHNTTVTRGHGLLESFLSRLRANKANSLIPDGLRRGAILDIGCGSFPYFLSNTQFRQKFAMDQLPPSVPDDQITWHVRNINEDARLPFKDGELSAITLLAVAEHIRPESLTTILREAYRVLQPGGRIILTTPAGWTDGLLKFMARVGLLSREEIDEHVMEYSEPLLAWHLGRAGFAMDKFQVGTFEFGLNLWAMAER
ncbi:MAG: methyltransferase domain-containing protein [Anaerolineales bacterium]|nr:methyltransferase domain-containing protein [Anaerolineales bacterium]